MFVRIRQLAANGPYDLILLGGLFDYLNARQCSWLLGQLAGALAPAGRLFFTNIAMDNPHRFCMENVTHWRLIHRNEEDIRAIVSESEVRGHVSLSRDASGLAHLVTVTRP